MKEIKLCLRCNVIEELPENRTNCQNCGATASLGAFRDIEHFQRFLEVNKPDYLIIKKEDEHLQYMVDEVLGIV